MLSKSLEETIEIAHGFVASIVADGAGKRATVVALSGDLGTGKTAFTQAVAKYLGITEDIVSPTFVIEKIYKIQNPKISPTFTHLIHIDAYRVEDESELGALGFSEIVLNPQNLIFIEWPEKLKGSLPTWAIKVTLTHASEQAGDTARNIEFEAK